MMLKMPRLGKIGELLGHKLQSVIGYDNFRLTITSKVFQLPFDLLRFHSIIIVCLPKNNLSVDQL